MEGFIVLDFAADFAEAMKQMAVWVSQGQVKSKNTVVKGGLQKADQALADMFKGINTGKQICSSRSSGLQTGTDPLETQANWLLRSRTRIKPRRRASG